MDNLRAVIEALIFASETPISLQQIGDIIDGVDKQVIENEIRLLTEEYGAKDSGVNIVEVAGGYQFRTTNEVAPWLKKLNKLRTSALSMAAIETLAVVAYRQPVLKSEVDGIRGVDTGGTLKNLIDKKLVRILGRKDVPGKPMIYGTTKKFLEVFNLRDLTDLPTLKEFADFENT